MGVVYKMTFKLNIQAIGKNHVKGCLGPGKFRKTTVIIVVNDSICILQWQVRIHVCRLSKIMKLTEYAI